MSLLTDLLTRVRNIHWASGVYTIIAAEGSYAIANPDPDRNVKLIEMKTDPEVTGVTGAPVTATLLEPPANAGADFASIDITAGSSGAPERVECIVVPKTEEAEGNWFNMYVVPISRDREIPTAPLLWHLTTMQFSEPRLINFKIRFVPHLIGPPPEGRVRMVQMYPAADPTESQMGYSVFVYRTDRKGTGAMFQAPPEWSTDEITNAGNPGLLFGTEPPLIAADIPYVP